jgi:hypothetical protein
MRKGNAGRSLTDTLPIVRSFRCMLDTTFHKGPCLVAKRIAQSPRCFAMNPNFISSRGK